MTFPRHFINLSCLQPQRLLHIALPVLSRQLLRLQHSLQRCHLTQLSAALRLKRTALSAAPHLPAVVWAEFFW
jgi:hypothetical protein